MTNELSTLLTEDILESIKSLGTRNEDDITYEDYLNSFNDEEPSNKTSVWPMLILLGLIYGLPTILHILWLKDL